jgi:hypothetical protein
MVGEGDFAEVLADDRNSRVAAWWVVMEGSESFQLKE